MCGVRERGLGRELGLRLRLLLLEGAEQRFVFEDVPAAPVPSLLRGFSAPVRIKGVRPERLRFLAVHDNEQELDDDEQGLDADDDGGRG